MATSAKKVTVVKSDNVTKLTELLFVPATIRVLISGNRKSDQREHRKFNKQDHRKF